ncbi:TetR/AcrR family transcriptional regulator [Actinopolymorpha pittospori]
MPRAGLSTTAVVDAALAHVDKKGVEALTLAAVAEHTGVAAPSLYKHVRNLAELRRLLAVRALEEITGRLASAVMGRSGDDAVGALMRAWRAYASEHPNRYSMLPPDPLADPVLAEPGRRMLEVALAVLHGYGLGGAAAIHATRNIRAAMHGFASLEAAGGFGLSEDLDVSYDQLCEMVTAGLRRLAEADSPS